MNQLDFVKAVKAIADSRPAYREGGTGRDGTCDCIGLIMGAMYRNGKTQYPLHSSNYFARYETDGLESLADAGQLKTGMIVYKARSSTAGLNARYQPGGRYDTGDMLDYYHAGVVTGVGPLVITHCTSTGSINGIACDSSVKGWTHCGWVKGVTMEESMAYTAIVTAASGSTVNLRSRPDANSPLIARIPVGTAAAVSESADGWARITADGMTGYMMETFLQHGTEDGFVRIPRETLLGIIDTLKACVLADTEEESDWQT